MIEKITTSFVIDQDKYKKFKILCVERGLKMGIQIEAMILKFIEDCQKREDKKNENKK